MASSESRRTSSRPPSRTQDQHYRSSDPPNHPNSRPISPPQTRHRTQSLGTRPTQILPSLTTYTTQSRGTTGYHHQTASPPHANTNENPHPTVASGYPHTRASSRQREGTKSHPEMQISRSSSRAGRFKEFVVSTVTTALSPTKHHPPPSAVTTPRALQPRRAASVTREVGSSSSAYEAAREPRRVSPPPRRTSSRPVEANERYHDRSDVPRYSSQSTSRHPRREEEDHQQRSDERTTRAIYPIVPADQEPPGKRRKRTETEESATASEEPRTPVVGASQVVYLRRQVSKHKDENSRLDRERRELKATNREQDSLLRSIEAANLQLQESLQKMEAEMKRTQRALSATESKLEKTTNLLDVRTAELLSAQAFLNKADDVSEADVVQMVESINAEIHQTASGIADSFTCASAPSKRDLHAALSVLHPSIVDLLKENIRTYLKDPSDFDTFPVQTAIQAYFTSRMALIANSWSFAMKKDASDFMDAMYTGILSSEKPTVAKSWRAMTRAQMPNLIEPDSCEQILVESTCTDLFAVLRASGWASEQNPSAAESTFLKRYKERIGLIVQLSVKLNITVHCRILTKDLTVWAPGGPEDLERRYDSRLMGDAFDEGLTMGSGTAELAVCAIAMGLSEVPGGGSGTTQLLKPQVVLRSFVDKMVKEKKRMRR